MRSYVHQEKLTGVRSTITEYVVLAKPGIVALVMVSAFTGLYLGSFASTLTDAAALGVLDNSLILWTLCGIALATAGSAMLNNYFDRDIDALMERTRDRALASGSITPEPVLISGLALSIISIVLLASRVNMLAAALTAAASIGYVAIYGIVLKRRTSLANQVGGLAGALPPVIGYVAATGSLDLTAGVLFFFVALWQQPHALSLALKYTDDYRAAGIPAVPVIKGVRSTKLRILCYTVALLFVSVAPFLTGLAGPLYLATAIVLGSVYVALSLRFVLSGKECDMFLFFYSIAYITLTFAFLVMDVA